MLKRNIHPIVLGGAAVGVLDIVAAFALRGAYGAPPIQVLQGIASGILGPAAFRGGVATAGLGLSLHFLIAFLAASMYYPASRWWSVLVRRPVICGLAYGAVVHFVMNAVVLPLSRVSFRQPPWHFVAAMGGSTCSALDYPIALVVGRQPSIRSALASASRWSRTAD